LTAGPSIRVQGDRGELQLFGDGFRPVRWAIVPVVGNVESHGRVRHEGADIVNPQRGMWWEADEAARCVRDGKLESAHMPLAESLAIMRVMDEARRQGGLVYPAHIETLEYPLERFF
jgi:hypothetical protein